MPCPVGLDLSHLSLWFRHLDLGSDLDMRAAARPIRPVVGHDHKGLSVPDMNLVSPVGIGLAAA